MCAQPPGISRARASRLVSGGLLALLTWIGESFGQVNSHGWRFSLAELNLTHKALAELCGLTRVTVTKLLSRYRLEGQLVAVSNNDLLIPRLS